LLTFKSLAVILLTVALLATLALPVFAVEYNPGVSVGQYAKYGNFVGTGPGVETFNDIGWQKLQITGVSGKAITLLFTSQYKNGTATPGNGTVEVWNIETGTENGVPNTQGPIVAANLNQGDAIPPPNTYTVNRTETRTYLGVSRTVTTLDVTIPTSSYNTSLSYVYDRTSGMLLQSTTQTTTQPDPEPITTSISYSIIETNLFGSTSTASPSVPEFSITILGVTILAVLVIAAASLIIFKKKTSGS
jgi:hypothetical protein